MAKVLPPKDFASAKLQIHIVSAGHRYGRIFLEYYPNALGFGKTPSRFSDPRKRITAHRFGVLYLGQTIRVCFLEAVVRDQRDGIAGDLPIAENELLVRRYAEIETIAPLRMVDLRDDNAVIMGETTTLSSWAFQQMWRREDSKVLQENGRSLFMIIRRSRTASSILRGSADKPILPCSIMRSSNSRSPRS